MQMSFPSFVHGMLKMDSFAGVVQPDQTEGVLTFKVPAERRINETRMEVRYSPTLATAMVDALPYMVEYPYGCTEQTLNRFLPTVITMRVLQNMKLDLKDIEKKRTNLNAQEIGDAQERAKERIKRTQLVSAWRSRFEHNRRRRTQTGHSLFPNSYPLFALSSRFAYDDLKVQRHRRSRNGNHGGA